MANDEISAFYDIFDNLYDLFENLISDFPIMIFFIIGGVLLFLSYIYTRQEKEKQKQKEFMGEILNEYPDIFN